MQLLSDAVHHHVMMREHQELQTRVSAQHLHVVANRTNLNEFNNTCTCKWQKCLSLGLASAMYKCNTEVLVMYFVYICINVQDKITATSLPTKVSL